MLQHQLSVSGRRFGLVAAALVAAAMAACASQSVEAAGARPAGCPDDGTPQANLTREQLTILTSRGPVRVEAQVADEPEEQSKGLMFVRSLPDSEGMLFDFEEPQPLSFWMHNTFIPLDLLFIDGRGKILNIKVRAQPCDETPIPSAGRARAVLELAGGATERLGIKPGDQINGRRIYPAR